MIKTAKAPKIPRGSSDRAILNRATVYLHQSAAFEKFSPKQWKEDAEKYFGKGKCAYCGKSASPLEREHVIPLNRKGLGLRHNGNTVPACSDCNKGKRKFDKQDDGQGYVKFCEQEGYRAGIRKIRKYMKEKGYKPLVEDETKRKKIEKIICKANSERAAICKVYAKKIAKLIISEGLLPVSD